MPVDPDKLEKEMSQYGKEILDLLHKCLDPYVPPVINDTRQSFKIIAAAIDKSHRIELLLSIIEIVKLAPYLTINGETVSKNQYLASLNKKLLELKES